MSRLILDYDSSYRKGKMIGDLVAIVRAKFSIPNPDAHIYEKKGIKWYQKRFYIITSTNRFDLGLYFDIVKYLKSEGIDYMTTPKLMEKVLIGVEDYEFKWIKDIKRSDLVLDIDYKKGMHYRDILMLAIKREEKALLLYNELQDKADTEDSKNVFKILCQEEAKHKLALESMYDDYMAEMGD